MIPFRSGVGCESSKELFHGRRGQHGFDQTGAIPGKKVFVKPVPGRPPPGLIPRCTEYQRQPFGMFPTVDELLADTERHLVNKNGFIFRVDADVACYPVAATDIRERRLLQPGPNGIADRLRHGTRIIPAFTGNTPFYPLWFQVEIQGKALWCSLERNRCAGRNHGERFGANIGVIGKGLVQRSVTL
ncbi:MAG: hypothetical protein EA363_05480 [Balneolaceae bacterium]|nr:MAG: hypothetical protein EA363_05480 [Balneolaceae bacterium]